MGGVGATVARVGGAIASTVVLALLVVPLAPLGPSQSAGHPFRALTTSGSGCTEGIPGDAVSGMLTIVGGPLSPSVADDRAFQYSYYSIYRTIDLLTGRIIGSGCEPLNASSQTDSNGTFTLTLPLPAEHCAAVNGSPECTVYYGPLGPLGLSVDGGPFAGYRMLLSGSSTAFAARFVYQLANVTLSPSGAARTTSTGAPTSVSAVVEASNGQPTELAPVFAWSLNGTGWAFVGSASSPSVTVEAVPGAGIAELAVRVSATDGGSVLPPVTAQLSLSAIPTVVQTASANRTSVDTGAVVRFDLSAVGAAGFSYTAAVQPGLGLTSVPAVCSSRAGGTGTVMLECGASVVYPSTGLAQPTAAVTNGYSAGDWEFPEVTVSGAPALTVEPAQPVGYAGQPIALTIDAVQGAGARPYLGACLASGAGPADCSSSPGPGWGFSVTYGSVGNFSGSAWAHDADGVNASVRFTTRVFGALAVDRPTIVGGANASVGTVLNLAASVEGGVPPMRYWWNSSGGVGSLGVGTLTSDGSVAVDLVPSTAGALTIGLTVDDALGSIETSELVVSVAPAPAERVAPLAGAPSGAVVAGTPTELGWGAFDQGGALDRGFAAPAELSLGPAPLTGWVNASGVGPLAALGNGSFGVPAAAWLRGVLNVTVTIASAGAFSVRLSGAAPLTSVPVLGLVVGPDRAHVLLSDPSVARPGDRANATLWKVGDRFGNPVPGALLTEELTFGGSRTDRLVAAIRLAGGGSGVWVNYTSPGTGPGQLRVLDLAGQVVLGPVTIPAAPVAAASGAAVTAVATVVPAGAVGLAAFAVVRRRRRTASAPSEADELRTLAEGRHRLLEMIGEAGALDVSGIEEAWRPPPAPPALADWLASLVTDGALRATVGEDGRVRFCLAEAPEGAPRVTLDAEALDRSLRRRDDELGESTTADEAGTGAG